MREYPILFSPPMIRRLLVDQKFVTRRLDPRWMKVKAGDRLWARETHTILDMRPVLASDTVRPVGPCPVNVNYIADDKFRDFTIEPAAWRESFDSDHVIVRPSIHMPRWASRILLECEEDTRQEWLQSVTEGEAIAEGCGADDGLECGECGWLGFEDNKNVLRAGPEEDWHFLCPGLRGNISALAHR